MSVLGKCLQINKSNLFTQSSRTPFSLTYFIRKIKQKVHEKCHFKFRGHQINCEMRKYVFHTEKTLLIAYIHFLIGAAYL